MFDAVAGSAAGRALVLGSLSSAAEDSAQRLRDHLSEMNVDVEVVAFVVVGAAAAASAGDHTELGRLLADAALSGCKNEDVVVLAQYSLAPAWAAASAAVQVPVLSPPHLAATTLRDRLLRRATMTALGCIADDFTGGTDVAAALRRSGLSVVLLFGVPDSDTTAPDCDAVVIALKTRTVPADEAVAETLRSYEWLRARGFPRVYFKYCSTFDSTDRGNIGPVADALLGRDRRDRHADLPGLSRARPHHLPAATSSWATSCSPTHPCGTTR